MVIYSCLNKNYPIFPANPCVNHESGMDSVVFHVMRIKVWVGMTDSRTTGKVHWDGKKRKTDGTCVEINERAP